jgi:hypothetical protein
VAISIIQRLIGTSIRDGRLVYPIKGCPQPESSRIPLGRAVRHWYPPYGNCNGFAMLEAGDGEVFGGSGLANLDCRRTIQYNG